MSHGITGGMSTFARMPIGGIRMDVGMTVNGQNLESNAHPRPTETSPTANPKKKRRTNAKAAKSTVSQCSNVQDLWPPLLTGCGDTVVVSNPFDDTPSQMPTIMPVNTQHTHANRMGCPPMKPINTMGPMMPHNIPNIPSISVSHMGSISAMNRGSIIRTRFINNMPQNFPNGPIMNNPIKIGQLANHRMGGHHMGNLKNNIPLNNQINNICPNNQMNNISLNNQMNNISSNNQMNNISPNNQMNNISLNNQMNNICPNIQMSNISPNNQMNNISPNNQMNNISSNNQMNNISPNNQMNNISPNNQMNTISPNNQINNISPNNQMHTISLNNQMNNISLNNQINNINPHAPTDNPLNGINNILQHLPNLPHFHPNHMSNDIGNAGRLTNTHKHVSRDNEPRLVENSMGQMPRNRAPSMRQNTNQADLFQNSGLERPLEIPKTKSYVKTWRKQHSDEKIYPADQPIIFDSQNPHAPPIYPCGICHKEVNDHDRGVVCESGCNFWFHRVCLGLSEAAFQLLSREVYAEWVCDNCLRSKDIPMVKFKP